MLNCFLRPARGPARSPGFTLIELLIVVAIIAILAGIAVVNMLEAQTRSKVSRIKSDMRSMITAIESYHVDNNNYPVRRHTTELYLPEKNTRLEELSSITSPVAYISSLPEDVFEKIIQPPNNVIDYWDPRQTQLFVNHFQSFRPRNKISEQEAGWMLVSVGPDSYMGQSSNVGSSDENDWPLPEDPATAVRIRATVVLPYDPTNGTVSVGNIYAGQVGGVDSGGDVLYQRILP